MARRRTSESIHKVAMPLQSPVLVCHDHDTLATGYYSPIADEDTGWLHRSISGVAVLALHAAMMLVLAYVAVRPEAVEPIRALTVRMIEPVAARPPKLEPPKPLSPQPALKKALKAPTPPIMTAARRDDAEPARFTVAPQPEPVATPLVQPPVAAPTPMTAARFDADYLQNPKPVYPAMSRRLGEEGKIVLRVRVSRDGLPLTVEISQSSGFTRLDEAAKSAVERWRFVPARQGDAPVEATVLVPLNFTLNH